MNLKKVLENQISELEKVEVITVEEAVTKAETICSLVRNVAILPKEAIQEKEFKVRHNGSIQSTLQLPKENIDEIAHRVIELLNEKQKLTVNGAIISGTLRVNDDGTVAPIPEI